MQRSMLNHCVLAINDNPKRPSKERTGTANFRESDPPPHPPASGGSTGAHGQCPFSLETPLRVNVSVIEYSGNKTDRTTAGGLRHSIFLPVPQKSSIYHLPTLPPGNLNLVISVLATASPERKAMKRS